MEVFRLFGRILVDDKEAQKSLQNTDKNTKSMGDRLRGGIKTAVKWGAALTAAAVGAGAGLFALANRASKAGDEIFTGAAKAGVGAEAYQEMHYWANQNNISASSMDRAMGRLNQRIGRAADGNEKYAKALQNLGIDMDAVREGTLSTEDAMIQSIQALSEMDNAQEQSAAASELFGTKLARDLMPALQDGSMSFEDAAERARELGIVMSEDQVQASYDFQQSIEDAKQSLGSITRDIGLAVMPMFQSMLDWILGNMPAIRNTFSTVFGFAREAISWVTDGIQNILGWLTSWLATNDVTLSGIWEAFQTYLGLIIEYWTGVFETGREIVTEIFSFIFTYIQEILTQIYEFWQEHGEMFIENVREIFGILRETVMTVFFTIFEFIQEILEQLLPFIQEKLQILQEFWQENGQQIMEAVQNLFSFIHSVVQFFMPAIQFIIELVLGIVKGLFNGALNIIMGLVKTFSSLFTGDWRGLWDGIKQLLAGALEFVWNLINLTLIGRGLALVRNFATAGINLFRNLGTNIGNVFSNIMSTITNIVSRIVSSVLNFFRNMGSGIRNTASNILTNIRNAFNNVLSFITGLRTRFLNAGKGLIENMVKGIKNAATLVTDAVSNLVGKVRDFLPFSPAKEGPLSDLDKLDFGGPIEDSIDDSEHAVKAKMAHLLTLPNLNGEGGSSRTQNEFSKLEELLIELIQAVKDGKNIVMNDKVIARETGDARAEEDGKRVRNRGRELAT